MSLEVTEFIIIAPAVQAKAVEWAEHRLRSYLEGHFPLFSFRIEPFGPLSSDSEYTVLPVMNRRPFPAVSASDRLTLLTLDPTVIPEIRHKLRSFDLAGVMTH